MLHPIRLSASSERRRIRSARLRRVPAVVTSTIALAAAVLGCGGSVDGGETRALDTGSADVAAAAGGAVETASGALRLEVPSAALAADTTITMTERRRTPVHPHLEGSVEPGQGVVYELEPDGLAFATPAGFRLRPEGVRATRTAGGWEIPMLAVFSVDGDGVAEPLEDVEVEVDPEDGDVEITGEISHFSSIEVRLARFGRFVVDGLPDAPIEPGDTFEVDARLELKDVVNHAEDIETGYFDFSIFPVVFTGTVPDRTFNFPNLPYVCDFPGGIGLYQVVMKATLAAGVDDWIIGTLQKHIRIPARFFKAEHVLSKRVDCRPPPPKVSFMLPSTESAGEHGVYEVVMEIDSPVDFDFEVPLEFAGSAKLGVDFGWEGDTDEEDAPVLRLVADQGATTGKFRLIDDIELAGDLSLDIRIRADYEWPEEIEVPVVPQLQFWIRDDSSEPHLEGAGALLFADPPSQTALVGQSATIMTSQSVLDEGETGIDVHVIFEVGDPAILGAPSLLPQPMGEGGTLDVVLDVGDSLPLHYLGMADLHPTQTNEQTLAFPCLSAGETTVTVNYFDGLIALVSPQLARQTLAVKCETPPEPEIVLQIDLRFSPELFGGYFGPNLGPKDMPAGDPFGSPPPQDSLGVLDLDPARDYALLVSETEGYGVWDLTTGLEVERLKNPFVSALDAIFLHSPDSSLDSNEWIFFRYLGGYGFNRYNPDSMEFGITRLFPGGFVTDIVHGPRDENGRDTGYIVTNFGTDSIGFAMWDPALPGWGGDPTFFRSKGEWHDQFDEAADGDAVSTIGGFDGKALVLVDRGASPGALWTFDPRETVNDNTDENIGAVGLAPAFLRCLEGVCLVTNFGSDSVTTVTWPSAGATPAIVQHEDVGAGPYGIDLIPNPGGDGVLAAVSNLEDDSLNVLEVGADGVIDANRFFPVDMDCDGPSQARFTDGEGTTVMVLCTNSKELLTIELGY